MENFKQDKSKFANQYDPRSASFEKPESNENLNKFERFKETFIQYASLWREYPDLFIDAITPPDSTFKLYFYQRIFLRAAMRHKYMYATFTRAFSKSFLSILALYLRCIFFPKSKQFVCSGGKEQAANIAKEKIQELWDLFPILKNEISEYSFQKDYVELKFHNGSRFDVVAVRESTRGGRRNAGLVEEVILVDGDKLNSVVIPLMNVDRRVNGKVDPDEVANKSQIYVTTAGYKGTFAYQKLMTLLVWQALGRSSFVFGGGWKIPVAHGLLTENFVDELKEDGTFNELSFGREYESRWSGSSEDAFFNADMIDKHRLLKEPEFEPNRKKKAEYVISVDVARSPNSKGNNCDTAVTVIKMIPRENGTYSKHIVNIFAFNGEHFLDQAVTLKKLVQQFGAKMLVVDANGLGIGLVDYLVKSNEDEQTGEIYPPYSVVNDDSYDKFKTQESIPLLYNVKANASNSSQIHVNALSQISSGKVRFLQESQVAKARLLSSEEGQKLRHDDSVEFAKKMAPFVLTDILKEEMLNLQQKHEGKNIQLDRINKRINKDKWSAMEYGLWYIKELEDKNVKRKSNDDIDQMLLFRKPMIRPNR